MTTKLSELVKEKRHEVGKASLFAMLLHAEEVINNSHDGKIYHCDVHYMQQYHDLFHKLNGDYK